MRHARDPKRGEDRTFHRGRLMTREGRLTDQTDTPPTRTIKPMDPSSPSGRPTATMLQGDIDRGLTGDKNPMFDPSGVPLGTDDEAAGTPPTPLRVAVAIYYE